MADQASHGSAESGSPISGPAAAPSPAPAPAPVKKAARKRRVLCLHGWRTNTSILEAQTMFLRSRLPKSIDLVMLQAPIKTDKPADKDIARVPGPYYQWWIDAIDATGPEDIKASAQKAVQYAADFVATNGPFDAILGFSQGAAMATMLTRHLAKQSGPTKDSASTDGEGDSEKASTVQFPWNGNICVCAGAIPNKEWEIEYTEDPLRIPSLHIIGERDKVRSARILVLPACR